ncbi:MAG TPA: putative glycoside hydrolase [Pseudogracilibacillus sp.]|nr:putative glycoside hydrolase [Pseudogracilibacillus sp.]
MFIKNKILKVTLLIFIIINLLVITNVMAKESDKEIKLVKNQVEYVTELEVVDSNIKFNRFTFDSGLNFNYPEAVRGIYVTGNSAGGDRFKDLLNLVETTDLNAMVIDIKDDFGKLTYKVDKNSPYSDIADGYIDDLPGLLKILEEKEIYPIARVVVFKDSAFAEKHPEYSFLDDGKVWKNNRGEAFVNPFEKKVWKYNLDIAKEVAKLGFQDIQFDYVRFPEGFETRDDKLEYSLGDYENSDTDGVQKRVEAVTDFVKYAREELAYYGVNVSIDIFGYAATISEAPGIGQNFSKISENTDVISSMIYPSHWTSYFGIKIPDKEPYNVVNEYAKVENNILNKLENKPISRPWIQDFSAPWLYSGTGKVYKKEDVEAQIKALSENGIKEYLIWNPRNVYSQGVNYIQ